MAKAKRLSERHGGRQEPQAPKEVFDSPFKQLKKLYTGTLDRRTTPAPKPSVPLRPATTAVPIPVPVAAPDDKQLFQEAFRDVQPLGGPRHAPPACEPGLTRTIVS